MSRRDLLRLVGGGLGAATVAGIARPWAPLPATAAAAPRRGGELIFAGTGELKFDPYFQAEINWITQGQIWNALFDYLGTDPFKPRPQLAESWKEMDKELTVKLRPGVKFHNGRELGAQDVVDNINRAKDKSIGHFLYDYFNPSVDGAEASDRYTVRIVYKKTYPLKLDDLTILYLIPKEAMAEVATKPMGTGPFRFVNYTPGDKLEMARFDQYWEQGKPYVDKVTIKIIPDAQARLANLRGGTVDFVDSLAPSDIVLLKNRGNVQVSMAAPGGFWYTNVLNCAKKPLDNKLVRQALNYSVDREKINRLAYYNLAPATQSRYLPASPWYNKQASTQYTFDLKKASALLQQAGLPNGFATTLSISDAIIPGSKAMAQVWAQDLQTIGIKLTIVEKEQGPFYDDYFGGNYEIQGYLLGDGKSDPASGINNSSPLRSQNNKANIQTQPFFAEYAKLVDDGINSIDPKVRKPVYDRIQRIWADESWTINLAFAVFGVVLSRRVAGFRPSIDQVPHFGNVWLEG
jgi:peptide/nickel transport system substrate-binding protein